MKFVFLLVVILCLLTAGCKNDREPTPAKPSDSTLTKDSTDTSDSTDITDSTDNDTLLNKHCIPISYTSSVDGTLYGTFTLTYEKDTLIKQIRADYTYSTEDIYITDFFYNTDGRLERLDYSVEGQVVKSRTLLTYSSNLITCRRYTSLDGINFGSSHDSTLLDLQGSFIKKYTRYSGADIFEMEGYDYDSLGNVSKVTRYFTSGVVTTANIGYKTGANPYRFIGAHGLVSPGYQSISRNIPVTIDGQSLFTNTYDAYGNLKSKLYYSGAEGWTDVFTYTCK